MKKKLIAVLILAVIAVMGLSGSALALDPPTVYGIDRNTGDVYEAEVETGTAEWRFNATDTLISVVSPNGLAWNPLNGYLYFTDYPLVGVGNTAFYYWNGSSVQPVTDALGDPVMLTGDVACGTFDSAGNYYYIDGGGTSADGNYRTDDLYMVTFDASFNVVSETKVADLTVGDEYGERGWKFDGDIAYKGGYIYGYGSYGWYTFEFFKVQVGTWDFERIKDFGSWYKGALQLSFGQDGTLYCHASQDAAGTFYAIDLATGTLSAPLASSATAADGHVLLYTDLSAATGAEGLAMVAGTKWNDVTPNGYWDPGDVEKSGWTINLYKWNVALNKYDDTPYKTAVTGDIDGDGVVDDTASGGFFFQITEDGLYKVEEVQQTGWTQTGPLSPNYFEFEAVGNAITPVTPAAFDYMNMEFWNHQSTADISGHKYVKECECSCCCPPECYLKGLEGWTITLARDNDQDGDFEEQVGSTETDADGAYSFSGLTPGVYQVSETMQSGWAQRYPKDDFGQEYYIVTVADDGSITVVPNVPADELDFINYKKSQNTTGYTPGFWSNKNGRAVLTANPGWMGYLGGYNLVDGWGNPFDPTSYNQFRTWLLRANGTNMSYMMSVQMAATLLNINYMGTDYDGLGVIGWDGNWISIADLIIEADAFLGTAGNNYTPRGHRNRAQAEFYKNVFDSLNNNSADLITESEAASTASTKSTTVTTDVFTGYGYNPYGFYNFNWWSAWYR